VSAFKGKDKIKALQLLLENSEFVDAFKALGSKCFDLTDDTFEGLEKFVCHLYGQKSVTTVNDARYNMFRVKYTPDACLPPNQDCLRQHSMRAAYQTAIYRRSLSQTISAPPSPKGHGWKVVDDDVEFFWMTNDPAPENILQQLHCGCKKPSARQRYVRL